MIEMIEDMTMSYLKAASTIPSYYNIISRLKRLSHFLEMLLIYIHFCTPETSDHPNELGI